MRAILATWIIVASSQLLATDSIPESPSNFLADYCLECHDSDSEKGEINLDAFEIDWSSKDNLFLWERVLKALDSGEMPPKKADQPQGKDRKKMIAWVDKQLTDNTTIGGTLARRLNRAEYHKTIKSLFGLNSFELPAGFPVDREYHSFDNIGEGLVLSPPLLESYSETARLVADEIFPPPRSAHESVREEAKAEDLVISYSSGTIIEDAMRLGMKCDPITRSCTWPSKIEIETSGVYELEIDLSTFRPKVNSGPMTVRILARDISSPDGITHSSLRLLKEVEVTDESPKTFRFTAELYEGQTPVINWANAPLDSDRSDKEELVAFFEKKDEKQPGYLASWHKLLQSKDSRGFRGGLGWEKVKENLARGDLPKLTEKQRAEVLKAVAGNPVLYAETAVFDIFENGPALEVHRLSIEGPSQIIDGPKDKERKKTQSRFLGDDAEPGETIERYLTAAFRRPIDEKTVQTFLALHDEHIASGHSGEEAMHLVIRNVLISPRFLYRSLSDGELDSYDLATRLSYFLTGVPPNGKLLQKAEAGSLTNPEVLRNEAKRLIPTGANSDFVKAFTGQWLDTHLLAEIMPDPTFKFNSSDTNHARQEAEAFFAEILRENRPMTDFIDPDFTWTTGRMAKNVYGLKSGYNKKKDKTIHRVTLPRGGRIGGLLGQSAVMMATANGVDTQPVLRGVWVLENIMGMPPPPPPKSVPALTPDTQGATTPRELLSTHTNSESCAGCHRKIDPVGFALENFDPVGRWREKWPEINQKIDASATMHDGTAISGIVDLKAWLVANINQFSECLSEKLLTYATGRVPNYSERKEIARIVEKNQKNGKGFQDLMIALIESETFRTK